MAISATTAMTTSSLHPISNMNDSAHARRLRPILAHGSLGRPRLPLTALAAACSRRSDRLAPHVRPRRSRWSGVVVDRLHRLRLFRSFVIVLHALLEGLDTLRDVAHQVRNLATTKQQQDDCDHDDPVPNAKRTHPATLSNARPATRPILRLKLGSGGVKNKDLSRVKSPLTQLTV